MALTGNTVQSTYLDLVQLEQSGAGLPSHAGKEAALYDGSGAQILGRSAVRHWLDPHPDAASFDETWEFSTTGDMTQTALETAGWTFSNCTAEVANGVLWITTPATANPWSRAYYTTSLSGDFDLIAEVVGSDVPNKGASKGTGDQLGVFGIGIDATPGLLHQAFPRWESTDRMGGRVAYSGAWADAAGLTIVSATLFYKNNFVRISRTSGTINFYVGAGWPMADNYKGSINGWRLIHSLSEASTYDRIHLSNGVAVASDNESSAVFGFRSIRRFE